MIRSAPFYIVRKEPAFSVVVPFFNESEGVAAVCLELRSVLQSMSPGGEAILIDDGSTDGTAEVLDRLAASWPQCRVYHLPQNEGQSAALFFGFSKALAPVIVTMDGDGQNDPGDIPRLLTRLDAVDMVVGLRAARQDSWARRKISRVANLIRAHWLGDGVSDAGCALKAFRREVVGAFLPIRTLYSFMPSLAAAAGFRVLEEPVKHRRRLHGDSKYSARSFLILPIVDCIGVLWFRSRRCRSRAPHGSLRNAGDMGEELYRRAFRRWVRRVAAMLILGTIALFIILPRKDADETPARRISLSRAERIALQVVPKGRIGSEQVSVRQGRPTWAIDVRLPASTDLDEIYIDAVDGHVIASRTESAAEDALESAVEEHHYDPKRPLPR